MAPPEEQELRLALVMNGGVSLAVWMGGVTRELDALRRGEGAYGALLGLTRSRARIDVIAGASAGGINGAVLALAIARGSTVHAIHDLWMDQGAIDVLLRDPMQRDAPSVLRGDEQLLAQLHLAMRTVGSPRVPGAAGAPVHLTITGTALHGEPRTYPDRYGAPIPDLDHRVRFRFRRQGPDQPPGEWPDDFALDGDQDGAAARLALAARSSASFPAAFEPSRVPIGTDAGLWADAQHPDMTAVAPDLTHSHWMVDGGVLMNTPFRPALDAIKTLPADVPVRRVLGYVAPDPVPPPAVTEDPAQLPGAPRVVLDALSRLPRQQSIGRELDEIKETNQRVARRREARENVLQAVDGATLEGMASSLLSGYVITRREAAIDDVLDLLLEGAGPETAVRADQVARVRAELAKVADPPWLPDSLATTPWRWGFAPVQLAGNLALDVLARAVALPELRSRRASVEELRRRLHEQLAELRRIDRDNRAYWHAAAPAVFASPPSVAELASGWQQFAGRLGDVARAIADILAEAWGAVPDDSGVGSMLRPLAADPGGSVLDRLVALDVVQRSSGGDLSGIEQAVELVLISGNAANSFDDRRASEDKLAGIQAGHFGAFYKRSWRANDWMWGRLDGADRLVRTLLDPRRIVARIRADDTAAAIATEVRAIATTSLEPALVALLQQEWEPIRPLVEAELDRLAAAAAADPAYEPRPDALATCHEAIRLRLQLEIVVAEVPVVAAAVRADRSAGTHSGSLGDAWEAGLPDEPLTPEQSVKAFTTCRVGEEKVKDEVGSDYFTRVSTRAGGVLGSLVSGSVKVKALKPGVAFVRGVLLSLYLLGRGVVESSNTGRFLVALALATGGALVAVFALGTNVPGLLLGLGLMLIVAGILLARLARKPKLQIALALGVALATIGLYYVIRLWDHRPHWVDAATAVLAVIVTAAAATWLGYRKKEPG